VRITIGREILDLSISIPKRLPFSNRETSTRPDIDLLSQLIIGVNTDRNEGRLTVVEEVKADKARWCTTVLAYYRLELQ
jgi:hypothetical protein